MQVTLKQATQEHLKNLSDVGGQKFRLRGINTVAILGGIFSFGENGCPVDKVFDFFPYELSLAAKGEQPFITMFPGVNRIITAKLDSMAQLDLIQLEIMGQGERTNSYLRLTEEGLRVMQAVFSVSTAVTEKHMPAHDAKAIELASWLIAPIMTATTYVRGYAAAEQNEWYGMARLLDTVLSGNRGQTPWRRITSVIATSTAMEESGQFILDPAVQRVRKELRDLINGRCPEIHDNVGFNTGVCA